jgi:hypothetical protein
LRLHAKTPVTLASSAETDSLSVFPVTEDHITFFRQSKFP